MPGAPLLVQDYHLYLVPSLVREARPEARIAHFVHIPWVGPDGWAVLPPSRSSGPSTRGSSPPTASASTPSAGAPPSSRPARRVLGRGADAEARSHANPIAIDAADLEQLAASPAVQERRRGAARASVPSSSCCASTAPIRRRTPSAASRRSGGSSSSSRSSTGGSSCSRSSTRRGRRSRSTSTTDDATEAAAAAVNDRFGRPGWEPVRLDVRDDFPASVAAFLEYDVLLVNPVKDGLNLVAKEAPLVNERGGAVVLSREAGAYEELHDWVLGVDPLDVEEQAEALRAAIRLPPRRSAQLAPRRDPRPRPHPRPRRLGRPRARGARPADARIA